MLKTVCRGESRAERPGHGSDETVHGKDIAHPKQQDMWPDLEYGFKQSWQDWLEGCVRGLGGV